MWGATEKTVTQQGNTIMEGFGSPPLFFCYVNYIIETSLQFPCISGLNTVPFCHSCLGELQMDLGLQRFVICDRKKLLAIRGKFEMESIINPWTQTIHLISARFEQNIRRFQSSFFKQNCDFNASRSFNGWEKNCSWNMNNGHLCLELLWSMKDTF